MSKKKIPTAKPVTTTTEAIPAEAPKKVSAAKLSTPEQREAKRERDRKYAAKKRAAMKAAEAVKSDAKKPDVNKAVAQKMFEKVIGISAKTVAAVAIIKSVRDNAQINAFHKGVLFEAEKILLDSLANISEVK